MTFLKNFADNLELNLDMIANKNPYLIVILGDFNAKSSNKTIKNILSNDIAHETITCDDRDPPWINNKIKQLIQEMNNTYRSYILSNKNPQIFEKVKYLQNQLKLLTESNKKRC